MNGATLRAHRKRNGLTQRQLGLLAGYEEKSAERVVQLWEHDDQPIPLNKFRRLAKILRVPLDDFIPYDDVPLTDILRRAVKMKK